jgi:hypothetical protein
MFIIDTFMEYDQDMWSSKEIDEDAESFLKWAQNK